MDEHLQNNHLRYELRQLIIPLLHRCFNENPQDLIQFCSGYFQSLLDGRDNVGLSENHISVDGRPKERRRVPVENKPFLQGSTSLPILNEVASEGGLQLRETSSWNNGSSIHQIPTQRKNVHFNTADAGSVIGDQLNVTEVDAGIVDKGDKNQSKVWNSKVSTSSISNILERNKGRNNNVEDNNESTVICDKHFDSCLNNACTLSTSSSTEEIEEEFKTLVNLTRDYSCSQPASSNRKKWRINTDWQQERKLEISETNDVEQYNAIDSCKLEEEINKEFAALNVASVEDMTPNSSFGFVPKIKNLEKLVVPKENIRYSICIEDVESLVKSVSRTLQELIHVLCASRLYFNEKLEKVKDISVGESKSQSVEARHTPPRKKRSKTTFSAFDSRNEKNTVVSHTEHTEKDELNRTNAMKKVSNFEAKDPNTTEQLDDNRMKNKHFCEFTEYNEVNAVVDIVNVGPSTINEELTAKGSAINDPFKSQTKKKNETTSEVQTHLDESEHKKKHAEGNKNKSNKNGSHGYKEFSNSELEFSHGNVFQRSSKKRRNANNYHQDGRLRPSFDSRQAYNNRQARFPNECPTIRMPQGTSSRNRHPVQGYNNRPPRHMSAYGRGGHHQSRQRTESPNFLEGGDVLHSNPSHRTIGTETDFSQVNERPKNSNAKIFSISDSYTKTHNFESNPKPKLESKSSTSDRENEAFRKDDSNCVKVQVKNCTGKEATKIVTSERKEPDSESSKKEHKKTKFPEHILKAEPDSHLKNVSENTLDLSQEKETKEGKGVVNLSRPISNTSLNPSAKCFNPLFMRATDSGGSSANTSEQQKSAKSESDCYRYPGVFTHSKDSELSGKKYFSFTSDWTIESSENDVEEHRTVNNSSVSNMENDHSNLTENGYCQDFTPKTRNADQEIIDPNRKNNHTNRLPMENGFRGRGNGNLPDHVKKPDVKNNFKRGSSSDLKMAEGDHCNEEIDHRGSPPKQEEPGLSSASGDFVPLEEGINSQPNEEQRQEDILQNDPTPGERGINLPSMNVQDRGVLSSIPENVDRNGRRMEEIELNFSCLSDTDASELDSDLSEEYFYEERDEPEHDTC